MGSKYTRELLCDVISRNKSFAGVLRELECKQSGGMQSYIRKRVRQLGIDMSHFLGQAWNRGQISNLRRTPQDILVIGKIEHACILRRALLEIGRPYRCANCGQNEIWQNSKLILEVHHADGSRENNTEQNLEFLCPNCHSQTKNYGIRNIPE
jgi:predicted RNA-binding Zn-ribbon protein involved in translation (DUF1610 family)